MWETTQYILTQQVFYNHMYAYISLGLVLTRCLFSLLAHGLH